VHSNTNNKKHKMKKLLILIAFIYSACSAQVIGIKLNSPKTFTMPPIVTVTTDSITIYNIHDNGLMVTVDVKFYEPPQNVIGQKTIPNMVVWAGIDYTNNVINTGGFSKATLKNAVKSILQNLQK
jgi:hypothetical protein